MAVVNSQRLLLLATQGQTFGSKLLASFSKENVYWIVKKDLNRFLKEVLHLGISSKELQTPLNSDSVSHRDWQKSSVTVPSMPPFHAECIDSFSRKIEGS